ncbi:MAG TPA: WG repeat-containing protein, partial [Flavisolibacter sp.]|nr:WG repeat-containing protein [Flavisolibacter sp.]
SSFSEGLAVVSKKNIYGFVDHTGKEVIPFKYSYAVSFTEGHARIRKNGKWMIIDHSGKESPE